MRCWPRTDIERSAPWAGGFCALLTLLGLVSLSATASTEPGFRIVSANSTLRGGIHRVDAIIDFDFSAAAIEAMENGVAITVSVRMQVRRERALMDETIAEVRARYRIQTHSLSRRFLVTNLSTDEVKTFQSYLAMLRGLGRIENFPLLDDGVLSDGERYSVRIRATLDIESLPAPMRPLAYLSSSWRLSSDWTSWALKR